MEVMLNTSQPHSTKKLLCNLQPTTNAADGMCMHVRGLGLTWLLEKLDFPATLPLPTDGALIPVEYEVWANPIFVQWVATESVFVFTRYSSALSQFHCMHCKDSKRCRHFVQLTSTTSDARAAQAAARQRAIVANITSKCDAAGKLICLSHSSSPFPQLGVHQLQVLGDREAWIKKKLQGESVAAASDGTVQCVRDLDDII